MDKTKVYDLPTRLFHWTFALLFVGAFSIAKFLDDESPTYAYHMLLGLTLAVAVLLRLIWGFTGSRYARFSSFPLKPSYLLRYFKELFTRKTTPSAGHNPASSWAALVMMALALGLAVTGYLMSTGNKESLEEVHELLSNAFLVVALSHVAGVAFHTLRHRDAIGLSMISGKKSGVGPEAGIDRSHRGAALVFVAVVTAFLFHLGRSYDAGTGKLQLFGTTLQLGESEAGEHEHHKHQESGAHEEEDDD